MKKNIFPIVLILSLFITFFSCSNKPKKRPRKPVSSIQIKPAKQNYVAGEKVSVNVKTKLKDGEIENIQLTYGDKTLKENKELEYTINDISLDKVGTTSFVVNTEKTDGLKNTRSKSITVISDITPKKLGYQTINNFPHLTSSFTEGLEYYNGYLYEGTGENGKSKLLKIDIKTGKAVQSVDLNKKYFGEGITILNDKIYQLTYHAQKGFVYDLQSFAVIDSFRFKSQQGWGLTNDGTNLIMGDGTHVLTWLNPEDFSIVKKLEVADNKNIKTYLNELEYVDGYIYANVWTTDRIVKIDANSGKILEEIDLTGLINMYHNPGAKIDVLNGIAFDKENNRMFVTGKHWPKLFEVKFIEK